MDSSSEFEEDPPDLPVISDLNISNDHYYCMIHERPKVHDSPKKSQDTQVRQQEIHEQFTELQLEPKLIDLLPKNGKNNIRHALPAYDLWKPHYPTYLSSEGLQHFHRPKLRHFNHGLQANFNSFNSKPMPIKNLSRVIWSQEAKLRIRVQLAIQRGLDRERIINRYLRIYTAHQLTAKCGQIHLFEYSEQYPPVLSQVGMSSLVKVYKPGEAERNQLYFNEGTYGSKLKFIENNLYRAPIYDHKMESCDFLIIRTRNSFYIRLADGLYAVGQTMPLVEIPKPDATNITKFRSSFSNFHIHNLFKQSKTTPAHIKKESLQKLFPDYHMSTLQTRLKYRGSLYVSSNQTFIRGTSDYGLLPLKGFWNILTPEKYCMFMSMLVGREKLRELNYTDTMIDPPKDAQIETEVLAAPWNTSQALMGYFKGRNYLDFKSHLVDPTGSKHEGFSCVAWIKSPTEEQYQNDETLNQDRMANLLNRTQILNKIKYEKDTRKKIFLTEANHITHIQHKALGSNEILSSDEEDEHDDNQYLDESINDASFDNQVEDLTKLVEGQTNQELAYEKEEEIRRELLNELGVTGQNKTIDSKKRNANAKENCTTKMELPFVDGDRLEGKVLKITRKYCESGNNFERTEIVRDPRVIELYIREHRKKAEKLSEGIESPTDLDLTKYSGDLSVCTQATQQQHHAARPITSTPINPNRRPKLSLGPDELCRAEGTRLTISMSVLKNARRTRRFNV